MRTATSVLALVLLLHAGAAAQTGTRPPRDVVRKDVEAIVRARLADPKGPASISIAIVRGGEPLVEQAWGIADATLKTPATAGMTYRLASVSKQFTAALILKLVDRGRLSLKDTLGRHLSGIRREWEPITIEQLLNHTSGLSRDYRISALLGAFSRQPATTLLEWASRDEMAYPPGTRHLYSNTGYMVLGALIEQLYGTRYAEAIRDGIAQPLGLKTLGWCSSADKKATEVSGHWRSPQGKFEPAEEPTVDISLGSGGLCASAADVARWNQALHGGRVLSRASYTAMTTPRGAAARDQYGFGIRVLRSATGERILTHDGGTLTFVSENTWYPKDALSITVLYNSNPGIGTSPLAAQLANIARGRTPPPPAVTTGPARFAGFYEGRPGRGFVVTVENGVLHADPTDGPKRRLVHQAGTTYAITDLEATVTFNSAADGRPVSLTFRVGARERIFQKTR